MLCVSVSSTGPCGDIVLCEPWLRSRTLMPKIRLFLSSRSTRTYIMLECWQRCSYPFGSADMSTKALFDWINVCSRFRVYSDSTRLIQLVLTVDKKYSYSTLWGLLRGGRGVGPYFLRGKKCQLVRRFMRSEIFSARTSGKIISSLLFKIFQSDDLFFYFAPMSLQRSINHRIFFRECFRCRFGQKFPNDHAIRGSLDRADFAPLHAHSCFWALKREALFSIHETLKSWKRDASQVFLRHWKFNNEQMCTITHLNEQEAVI